MKLRCPYCKKVFDPCGARCPGCGRVLKLPASLRKTTFRERQRKREAIERAADRQRRTEFRLPTSGRGRSPATIISIIVTLLVAGVLLLSRVDQSYPTAKPETKSDRALRELRVLHIALERFRIDQGRYPTPEEGLRSLLYDPGSVTNWQRHYVTLLKPDPWHEPYRYAISNDTVSVFSAGPDSMSGTDDDIFAPQVSDDEVNWPPPEDDDAP